MKSFKLWLLEALPGSVLLAALFLYVMPKPFDYLGPVMPILPATVIYFFGLHHSTSMPYWLVAGAGLLLDSATGLPLGVSMLTWIAFLYLLHSQNRFVIKEGFVLKWGYFALLLLVSGVLGWLLLSFTESHHSPLGSALLQWLITIACYPLAHASFEPIERFLREQRWLLKHGR